MTAKRLVLTNVHMHTWRGNGEEWSQWEGHPPQPMSAAARKAKRAPAPHINEPPYLFEREEVASPNNIRAVLLPKPKRRRNKSE